MSIPTNITREHALKAIEKIEKEGVPSGGKSMYYDLLHEGKRYPPKVVVSYANLFANGEILERTSFTGGLDTPAFQLLNRLGFDIKEKKEDNMEEQESYYEELTRFLSQAKTKDQRVKHYNKYYSGLQVNVSFGKGNAARIPWISFLAAPNTTSKGIYPVYLYYKNIEKLILAYGVSETTPPPVTWNLGNAETIKEYFTKKGLGNPDRYGKSFVFKVYDVQNLPDKDQINTDLNKIIEEYKETVAETTKEEQDTQKPEEKQKVHYDLFTTKVAERQRIKQEPMNIESFREALKNAGLLYSDKLVTRFISSLVTKPFVILTGLSGSGKTKLAQAFTQWICQNNNQYCIVPVGADWTNREPLLGYPNALKPEEYVKPDNGVLDLIIAAKQKPQLPHFLILDEMNLSHVERYFADFLSAMESKEGIPLFAEGMVENGVPSTLSLPPNLFLIGTVNIDETTNMFSPKVLDRANTIEFRVTKTQISNFLNNIRDIDMSALIGKGASMGQSFLDTAANKKFPNQDLTETNETLVSFFEQLKKTGAEFGYRSASEILRLIRQLGSLDKQLSHDEKLDIAIMQKLLPKLHGSRRKLTPILSTLGSFCVKGGVKSIEKDVFEQEDFDFEDASLVKYPLSLEKIARMYKGAVDNGFASFAEA